MVTAISWEDLMCPTWWPKSVEIFFFPLSPRDTRQCLSSFHYAFDFFFVLRCEGGWARPFLKCALILSWHEDCALEPLFHYFMKKRLKCTWFREARGAFLRLLSKWNIFSSPRFCFCVSVYKPHMFTEKSLIPALHISSMGRAFNAVRSEAFPSSHLSTLADISNPHVTFV